LATVDPTATVTRERSPHLAAFLSFLFPGLGQWYGGRTRTALMFGLPVLVLVVIALIQVVGGLGHVAALLLVPSSAITIAILIGLLAIWRILSIADAMYIGRTRGPWGNSRMMATFGVLSLVVLLMHGVVGYTVYAFYEFSSEAFVSDPSADGTSPDASVLPGASSVPGDDFIASPIATPPTTASRINILLTGRDRADTRTTDLTDTLLIASIDPTTHDVALISFPRDISLFPLYNGQTYRGKINSFMSWAKRHPKDFPDGGLTSLVREMGYLLGAPIHYYTAIDLEGFRKMIDLVDGVTIDNPRAINDARYDWLDGTHGFFLSAGKHKLDGRTALAYVRSRQGFGDSDFSRARRQQQVLLALREKLTKPENLPKIPDLVKAAGDTIKTNFPAERIGEMVDLAQEVDNDKVKQYVLGPSKYSERVPASESGGVYMLRLKMDALEKLSISIFGDQSRYYVPPSAAPSAPASSTTP
jgi:LCP family protein required for cell wall assembly